jgi:hypothetical protein
LGVTVEFGGKQTIRTLRLPYDLRRTAVRNMARGGTDPAIAMKSSDHRTRAVFDRRSNIISEDDIRTAVRKTTAYVASPTGRLEGGASPRRWRATARTRTQ